MAARAVNFGTLSIDEAEGAILAHSVNLGARRLAKGVRLSANDIAAAHEAGVSEVVAAMLEPGDVHEDDAAATVAAALAGSGLAAEQPVHGRVNLIANVDGLLLVDAAMVDLVNGVDERLTLATLPTFEHVRAGDVAATIKIITFALPDQIVARCRIAASNPLRIAPFAAMRVLLIQTTLPGTSPKMLAKTADVSKWRAASLGLAAWDEQRTGHDEAALGAALALADADIVLVAGASATTDRRDVIPAAIARAGGEVLRLGMPVDPGNLLCLGRIGKMPVIGLPGCVRSPKYNGFDRVLERLFAGIDVTSGDIAAMGVGGLLADVPRPEPRPLPAVPGHKAGVIVLAAGRSVRMGANKLLADLGGRPVLAHVLDAVRETGLEAIVVTGHEAAAIDTIAADRGLRTVHAARYGEGLSQSLAAGISAAPADWAAAVVVLGDMPEVTAGHIRAVADAVRTGGIAVPVFKGKRGNPVAWGRRHFARLRELEGDIGGKALLATFADDVVEVAIDSDGVLIDVDTTEALAAARARHSS